MVLPYAVYDQLTAQQPADESVRFGHESTQALTDIVIKDRKEYSPAYGAIGSADCIQRENHAQCGQNAQENLQRKVVVAGKMQKDSIEDC